MARINNKETSKALLKNTGIIAIGQISTKVLSFLLLPLYTALLSTNEYGLVDLLATYASVIAVIVGMQLNQSVFRFLITERDNEKQTNIITTTVLLFTAITCIIYSLVFWTVCPFVHLEGKWYLWIHVIATLFLQTNSGIARGYGNNTDYAVGNFISALITIVCNVLFLAVFHYGVEGMLWAYVVGPIIGGLYLLIKCQIIRRVRFNYFSYATLKKIVKYSAPLVPNELSWTVIHASDRAIVSTFISITANGLVAVASKFSAIYTTVFSIFKASWTEQVVLHFYDEGGAEYVNDMFNKMITFFGSIAIGIIAAMPFVYAFLVNGNFSDAYNLVPIYMVAVFFNAVIGLVSPIYMIKNETKRIATSTMAAAAISVLTDIVLIRVIGIYAAPVSALCAYGFVSIWRIADINKRHCRIAVSPKCMAVLLGMLVLSLISFYCLTTVLQIVVLLLVAVAAALINIHLFRDIKSFFVHR